MKFYGIKSIFYLSTVNIEREKTLSTEKRIEFLAKHNSFRIVK